MRTTLTVHERPLSPLTRRAAESGTSVSTRVERAVQLIEADDLERFTSGR